MRMTPLDIQHQRFRKTVLGYDVKQVDDLLNNIQTEWEFLYQELHQKEEEVKQVENILKDLRSRENSLKDSIMYAQRMADGVKEQAQKEADLILLQATQQSDKMLRQAYDRLAKVIEDIRSAKHQKIEFEGKLKSLIEAHLKLLHFQASEQEERHIEHVAYLPRA